MFILGLLIGAVIGVLGLAVLSINARTEEVQEAYLQGREDERKWHETNT